MLKNWSRLAIVVFFLSNGFGCAPPQGGSAPQQESVLAKIKREKVIHAAYIKYPPFVIQDPKTNELSGYFIDLMARISELMNVKVSYEETDWATMVAGLQTKKFDIVVSGVFRTIPRAMEVTFPRPVLYVGISGIARKGDDRFKTIDDLKKPGLTIAVTNGEVGYEYAKRFLPDAKLIAMDTADISRPFLDVIAGRADIGLGDSMTCSRFAEAHQDEVTDVFAGRPFYVYGTTVMIRRDDQEWLDFLNIALEFMVNSGVTDELEKKYKGGSSAWISAKKPWE